jgi:hypothetical protein
MKPTGATVAETPKANVPAANALVALVDVMPVFGGGRAMLITSDTDGTLELNDVPPGLYTAVLTHTTYSGKQRDITMGAPREIAIRAQETTTADLQLHRAADAQISSLRVLVHDAKAEPVAGADVFIALEQLSDAADLNQAVVIGLAQRRARTSEKGEFALFPVPVGNWRVRLHGTTIAGAGDEKSKNFVAAEPRAVKVGAESASLVIGVK